MKVRVKKNKSGFIYGKLRKAGAEFTLEPVKHSVDLDDNGKPVVITVDQQFSKVWMEAIEKPKAKPGPKPEVVKEIKDIGNSEE